MSEHEIFAGALERTDPAERSAFLDQACGDEDALRQRVEGLLRAHARARYVMEPPAVAEISAEYAENYDGTVKVQRSPKGAGVAMSSADRLPPALASAEQPGEGSPLPFLVSSSKPGSLGRLDHYEVLAILGRGGFGIVLKACDELLQRVVAIKVMSTEMAATSLNRQRFLREGRACAPIRHDNVVQIYAVEEQPIPYLVMEYIAGCTLHQHLDETGPLGLPEVLRLGQQIANGLAAAHAQGLMHRDIKPANILLETGEEPKVKISDFGLARAVNEATLTPGGGICGTPNFMAPEQARGASVDQRADLFSLGSVLYVMVSGRLPFWAATPLAVLQRVADGTPRPIQEIIPEVPTWLCDLIAKLHAKKPEDRFQSAKEVGDLLGRSLAEQRRHGAVGSLPGIAAMASEPAKSSGPESDTVSLTGRPRLARKRRWRMAAALCVLLLALAGLGLSEATGITGLRENVPGLFSPTDTPVAPAGEPARPDRPDANPARANPDPAAASVDWLQKKADWLGHKGPVLAAAFSPNGKFLATSGADRAVRVWDPGTGTLLKVFDFRFGEPAALAFSSDGTLLVGGGTDYGLMAWDIDGWMERFAKADRKGWSIRCLAPHGNFILATGKTNGVHYFNLDGRRMASRPLSASEAWSIAMRADGKRLAIGLGDGNIDFWIEPQEKGQQPQRDILSGHKLPVRALAFSSEANLLVSGGADKLIRFWSSSDGSEVGKAAGHEGAVLTLALSANGKYVISGGADRTVRLWNTESFKQVSTPLTLAADLAAVAWSADGQTLATATRDGSVQLWRVMLPQ